MALPVNRVGAALDDTVRPHDRPPVSPEDLNRAQADKVRDGGGLASNVLNRRYGERGSIRECLEYLAGVSRDRDVDQCTAAELNQIDLIPPIARLANENSPRYQGMRDDAVREFLRLKKQRKVDREGANWHFRLPELSLQKCPYLDTFDTSSGVKFYTWKDTTVKQLQRHATTSAHKLELTKTLVPQKFQILVGHCKEAEEIFEILEHKIPPKSEIARYLEDLIALGGSISIKEGEDEMTLFRKAEDVQLLLTQLALVEPDYDIAKSSVDSCLLSFGSSAGSHLEQSKLTSRWYDLKRDVNQFLSLALDVWLENFKSALGSASATRFRAEKLVLATEAKKSVVQKQSRQNRQGDLQGEGGWARQEQQRQVPPSAPAPPAPPARPAPPQARPPARPPTTKHPETKGPGARDSVVQKVKTCTVCSKTRKECPDLMKCKTVMNWRGNMRSVPSNVCSLCLHPKDGTRHRYSSNADTKVCHWIHGRGAKVIDICCEHKMSKYLCRHCCPGFGSEKKSFTPSSQKRMSMKQLYSRKSQKCTPVHLPTVFQQREKVWVSSPDGNDRQALVVYDSGADHSMASPALASCDTSDTQRMAHDVMIVGSISSQAFDLPIIRLDIRSKVNEIPYVTSLNLAVKEMGGEREDPVWHGLPQNLDLKDPISGSDLDLPIILLGLDYINLHPVLCEKPNVNHLPGLVYFESCFTEKVLPVGRILPMRDVSEGNDHLAQARRVQMTRIGIQTEDKETKKELEVKQDKKIKEDKEAKKELAVEHDKEIKEEKKKLKKKQKKEINEEAGIQQSNQQGEAEKGKEDSSVELGAVGNFCSPLSSLPAIKALSHDVMMSEIRECWGPVEQSAAVSNVSKLGCMSCSSVPQTLLDKQDISFF